MRHSALLLAGGRSSRMGTDKALLAVSGQLLWQRQVDILRKTRPSTIYISARSADPFADSLCTVVLDGEPDLGPLSGVAAGLQACASEYLLVLAVDLPRINSIF